MNEEQLKLYEALTSLQKACVDIKLKRPALSDTECYRYVKFGTTIHDPKHDPNNLTKRNAFCVFNRDNVKAFLKSVEVETIDDLIMSRERILTDLSDIADTQLEDVMDMIHAEDQMMNVESGEIYTGLQSLTIKRLKDIPEHARKSIKSIKQGRYGIEITLYDAIDARKQISAMQGYNAPAKTELSGPGGGPLTQVQLSAEQFAALNKDLEDEF